jgi:hypothetical protein
MRYFSVSCGNGYCGCDEEWLMESEVDLDPEEVYDCYTYTEGAAGLRIGDDEFDDIAEDEYYENIMENIYFEEISEEEFKRLRDEESWEVR